MASANSLLRGVLWTNSCKSVCTRSLHLSRVFYKEQVLPVGSEAERRSDVYIENYDNMVKLVEDLKQRVAKISLGGDDRARKRHMSKGKLLPRRRIKQLLDPGSAFLEFSQFAGYELYGKEVVPAGGIISGIGRYVSHL